MSTRLADQRASTLHFASSEAAAADRARPLTAVSRMQPVGRWPGVAAINVSAIPDELRGRAQWVAWDLHLMSDQWKKVPIDPHSDRAQRRARVNEPATWGTFDEAYVYASYFAL